MMCPSTAGPAALVSARLLCALLLLSGSARCFRSAPPTPRRHHGPSPRSRGVPISHSSSGDVDASCTWEERLREQATDALLPVFFPGSGPASSEKPIAAEVALKRLLREKYANKGSSEPRNRDGGKSSNASRGRLAALVLGTSVMRLRCWHAVASGSVADLPIPYPLDSYLAFFLPVSTLMTAPSSDGLEPSASCTIADKRSVVRSMVDEQARYTSHQSPPELQLSSSTDKALQLAIHYSLPPFLAKSFLNQYGETQARRICSLMNEPGPIAIRKNCVRFQGSDDDLCRWLLEEDGIRAKVCHELPVECSQTEEISGSIMMTKTPTGNNRYYVGDLSMTGTVLPPKGALQILPNESNTTTTTAVEQRRSNNKSIWSMKGWQNGFFEVQDVGSQLIVQSLEVAPGDSILDYCAGNGGKTFGLASAVMWAAGEASADCAESHGNANGLVRRSQIVAHDVEEVRLRQIKGSLPRVGFVDQSSGGVFNGAVHSAQSSRGDHQCTIEIASSSDLDGESYLFDAVLVDAPCSSTGVLRRRPSQRWDLTEEQVYEELPRLQLEILEKAAAFVSAGGGKLVYSTCSLLREENEDVVAKFEQSSVFLEGGFERWGFSPISATDGAKDSIDDLGGSENTLTLLPTETGSDGFFIARWIRV